MTTWSLNAGRVFGVELRIHVTFVLLLLYATIVLPAEANVSGVWGAQRGMALLAIIFGSVIVHELAHVIASGMNGVRIRGTMLLPIGGITLADPNTQMDARKDLGRETRIAIAGPVANAVLALGAAAVLMAVLHVNPLARPFTGITIKSLSQSFFWINAGLCAINLLPALPLDGGRILRAWLSRRMEYQKATRHAVNIGHLLAAGFMFSGIVTSPWLMLVGLFMFVAAQMEERTVMFQSVVEAVHMEDIMLTEFCILSPADTLEDALQKAVHSLQDDFPVVRGGDLVGVINRDTIVNRLRREGNGYVQAAMSKAFEIASRSETLSSAFRKLTSQGLTLIPVVDQERLVGIVTLQNLMHSMGLLTESRRLRKQAEDAQP
ncbi:MAG TPA: site-2 protease family protein [Verrucomicrobiae bacterium]|jgi:Zn-dependent protease/predicted transcriptional regulator|nr:site-2 protease family protein [Verrucomicrobiae bacterium]